MAALSPVGGAVGDEVAERVGIVTAGVDSQVRSSGDGTAEEEEGVEEVEDDHDQRVEGELFLEGCRYEVDQAEHPKDAHEHIVVDDRGVAAGRVGDHVANEGHDEESPEELLPVTSQSRNGA